MSSVIIDKVISRDFSSNPALGAANIQNNGSKFTVNLNNPIFIPVGAVDCTVDVVAASIWFVQPNISIAIANNTFRFSSSTTRPGTYLITIPDGLYSIVSLNAALQRSFADLGFASNIMVLSGDLATQRVVITFTIAGLQANFVPSGTIGPLIGFNARTSPPTLLSVAGESDYGDNPAAFNAIDSFIIATNLIAGDGIPVNNQAIGVIARIPVNDLPGSQIFYQPNVPVEVGADNMIGQTIQSVNFSLYDSNLNLVDTRGEYWSLTLHVHYKLLLSTEKLPLLRLGAA